MVESRWLKPTLVSSVSAPPNVTNRAVATPVTTEPNAIIPLANVASVPPMPLPIPVVRFLKPCPIEVLFFLLSSINVFCDCCCFDAASLSPAFAPLELLAISFNASITCLSPFTNCLILANTNACVDSNEKSGIVTVVLFPSLSCIVKFAIQLIH